MAKPNEVEVEILEDGTLKITTGKVDMAIHARAEDALKKLAEAMGGKVEITNLAHHHHGTGIHIHGQSGIQH